METAWDNLIADGWTELQMRYVRNTDPTTGALTVTYMAILNTPEGQIVIEKPTATEAITIMDSAMTTIGPSDDYDEAVLRTTITRSENDQRRRDAEREYNRASYVADND